MKRLGVSLAALVLLALLGAEAEAGCRGGFAARRAERRGSYGSCSSGYGYTTYASGSCSSGVTYYPQTTYGSCTSGGGVTYTQPAQPTYPSGTVLIVGSDGVLRPYSPPPALPEAKPAPRPLP